MYYFCFINIQWQLPAGSEVLQGHQPLTGLCTATGSYKQVNKQDGKQAVTTQDSAALWCRKLANVWKLFQNKLTHKRAAAHLSSVMCKHIVLGHVDAGLCSDCEALHFSKKFLCF